MFTMEFDRWLAGVTVRGLWTKKPQAVLARIQSFEATEDDSSWQLLYASAALSEPHLKARLFMQSLEETHHAEIFRALYQQAAGHPLRKISVERRPLFQKGKAWQLFVYFTVGEKSAATRFRAIAEQLEEGPFRRALHKILDEEEGHVETADHMVTLTRQSAGAVVWEARRVRMRRAGEAWLRMGRRLTASVSRAILSGFYYAFGFFLNERRPL